MYTYKCKECDVIFESVHKTGIYCSRECYYAGRKSQPLDCCQCGSAFKSKAHNAMFCSRKCLSENFRKVKHPDRYRLQGIERQRRYAKNNPIKISAQKSLQYAVRSGKLVRPDHCEKCFIEVKPQGHHEDYNKPLEVMWLCPKCHKSEHIEVQS